MRCLAVALCALSFPLLAQPPEMWPGAQYDPAVPTIEKTLGFAPGTRHATHADIVRYFEALAAAAPGRIKVVEYGQTWEGRKLIYAIVGSEANLRRADEIKANQQKLADARKTTSAEAQRIAASAPVVLSLAYGVHGNEISSPDAALMTAYHLLAARNDKLVAAVMQNVVVLIDPLQNPDGRERFIANFRQNEGLEPDASPVAAERAEPWPGGRSNHYLFDMNRDWFAMTQPETRGRIRYMLEWLPQVAVDLHEMGGESTYFFAPGSAPYNPHLTPQQKEQMFLFGKNNARYFDQFGYPYFTREVYDEFYPGYGASWPWYYGGVGMTYENASVRGLVYQRRDGTLYSYHDSVRKHFIASISTCETAGANRQKLLENFYDYNRTAISEGGSEAIKEYVLPRAGDVSAVDKLAVLLASQGIEVRRAKTIVRNGARAFPAGSYSILAAQPRKRFIRTLLDAQTNLEPAFIAEQERRRKKRLPDQIYDVTGWSLPLLYNVECLPHTAVTAGDFETFAPAAAPKGSVSGKAEVAYLVPWGTQAAGRFLTASLRAGLRVVSAGKAFKQAGRQYPAGTLIVHVKNNAASVHEIVAKFAASSGAEVVAVNSSWVDDGIDFGSNYAQVLRPPVIAMLWDTPTSSLSAGATRFVLERQYGYPVRVIRTQSMGQADLSRVHVLILPDAFGGGLAQALGPAGAERLRAWVRAGGVLIAVGNSVNYVSSQGLISLQQERLAKEGAPTAAAPRPAEAAKPAAAGPVPGRLFTKPEDLEKAIQAEDAMPDSVAGVLVKATVDQEQWITAGLPESVHVLVNGSTIFSPLRQDQGVNAIIYAPADQLVASGYMWDENRKQLAMKPFVAVQSQGRGSVVAFTADPNFRAYMDGLNVLFLNAVFRAPGGGGRGGAEEER